MPLSDAGSGRSCLAARLLPDLFPAAPARHALLAAAVVAAALTGLSVLEAARDRHALLELARAAR